MSDPAVVPKSVRRGPPITVTCDCGEKRHLRYGERWTCEKCGKTWNTNRIPVEQYAAIRATQCATAASRSRSASSRWRR